MYFRTAKYLVNNHTLFEITNIVEHKICSIKPLLVLCIDSDAVEYYKLCLLTNTKPDAKIFTLMIDPILDEKSSTNKNLRRWFRTSYKPKIVELGIKIMTSTTILDTFCETIKKPSSVVTISDYNTWLEHIVNDFSEHSVVENKLKNAGF